MAASRLRRDRPDAINTATGIDTMTASRKFVAIEAGIDTMVASQLCRDSKASGAVGIDTMAASRHFGAIKAGIDTRDSEASGGIA